MNNYKAKHCCERCGKERPKHVKVDISVDDYIHRDVGWIALRCGSGYERDVDLCEDCMKEFGNWMNAPSMSGTGPTPKLQKESVIPTKTFPIIG